LKGIGLLLILILMMAVSYFINGVTFASVALLKFGLNHFQAFLAILVWTDFTLILTYYETDQIKNWIIKKLCTWNFSKNFVEKIRENISENWFNKESTKRQKKTISFLMKQKWWVIFLLGLFPVSFLPTCTIIAAKLMKIKYGLILLLIENALRLWLLLYPNPIIRWFS
jgi:hypothetical protein